MNSPVNPARGLFLKGYECAIESHYHRTSEHTEPTLLDKVITTWSLGCLCDLHPDYAPLNKWNHGFGLLYIDDKGWKFVNKRIVQGEVR